jgi:hypothetical protein
MKEESVRSTAEGWVAVGGITSINATRMSAADPYISISVPGGYQFLHRPISTISRLLILNTYIQ